MQREQKITLGEMRESGPTRLIVYCGYYMCAHSIVVDASRWGMTCASPTTCQVCGHRGADIRPLFQHSRMGTG